MLTRAERLKRRGASNARSRARKRGEPVPDVPKGSPKPPPRCPVCGALISAVMDCNCP